MRLRISLLVALSLSLVASSFAFAGTEPTDPEACPDAPSSTVSFFYEGDHPQYVEVPVAVQKVTISATGGHGGQTGSTAEGGNGGTVIATVPVDPGDCLEIYVPGYGADTQWGMDEGGDRGTQWGPGHDASYGAGSAGVKIVGGPRLVTGGGGGGGGGNAAFDGGAGGDGALGDGPDTARGSDGLTGKGVPVQLPWDLGGIGGWESGGDGGDGSDGSIDPFSGAGGGGGGGIHGGGGGANWIGYQKNNILKPVGGGGGGGGSSYAISTAEDVQYLVQNRDCNGEGTNPACQGRVDISWIETPTKVSVYGGSAQATPITSRFAQPLSARVTAASGDPVPDVNVEFKLPTKGPSATFDNLGTTTTYSGVTDENGVVTTPPLTANHTAGNWAATATADKVPVPATFGLTNKQATTATSLASAVNPSASGQPVTFGAVVGAVPSSAEPVEGVVSFEVDDESFGDPVPVQPDGTAVSEPVLLPPGEIAIGVRFEGSQGYKTSTATLTQTVEKATPAVSVASSENPSQLGTEIEFTATASAPAGGGPDPTGSVQFSVDGTDVGAPVELVNGQAVFEYTPALGPHVIRARYLGDENYVSAFGSMVQNVGPDATATQLGSSVASPFFGESFTVTADVSANVTPEGSVTFSAARMGEPDLELCADVTVEGGSASCPVDGGLLSAGDYEIVASFTPGAPGMDPSDGRMALTVRKAQTTTIVNADPDPITFGDPFALDSDVSANAPGGGIPEGEVQFGLAGDPLGSPVTLDPDGNARLPDPDVPAVGAGPQPISASFTGSQDFAGSSGAGVLSVDPADTTISLSSSAQPAKDLQRITFTAKVGTDAAGSPPVEGDVAFEIDGISTGDPVPLENGSAETSVDSLAPGRHDVRATFVGTPDFYPSTTQLIQTVDSKPPPPPGPIPCGPGTVKITSLFVQGDRVRVQGVARQSLSGRRVHINRGGRWLARTTVHTDGTFSISVPATKARGWAVQRYRAKLTGKFSRPSWIGRRIRLVSRSDAAGRRNGKRVTLRFQVRRLGTRRLTLGRMTGCGKRNFEPIRKLRLSPAGRLKLTLPRPKAGKAFAVYRLAGPGMRRMSAPIVIRAAR